MYSQMFQGATMAQRRKKLFIQVTRESVERTMSEFNRNLNRETRGLTNKKVKAMAGKSQPQSRITSQS
jgi:hypothetical protein